MFQVKQQGEDLDRLAQPHVVLQAWSQSQSGHEPEPMNTDLLIGPKFCPYSGRSGIKHTLGMAQFLKYCLQMLSRGNSHPFLGFLRYDRSCVAFEFWALQPAL